MNRFHEEKNKQIKLLICYTVNEIESTFLKKLEYNISFHWTTIRSIKFQKAFKIGILSREHP